MASLSSGQKLILRILAVSAILGTAYYLNQHGIFRVSLHWIDRLGPWAPVFFIGLSILASIFFVPSAVPNFAGGVLFGLSRGILFSLVGSGIGSVSAFLIGRYLAREWILKRFSKHKKFELIGEMVRRKGWKIVALARLSPLVPFLIGNYIFGLTHISARSYFAASVLGSIPSTAVYVYLGTLSRNLALPGSEHGTRTPAEWILLLGGLVATVILTFYLKRIAQHALRENQP